MQRNHKFSRAVYVRLKRAPFNTDLIAEEMPVRYGDTANPGDCRREVVLKAVDLNDPGGVGYAVSDLNERLIVVNYRLGINRSSGREISKDLDCEIRSVSKVGYWGGGALV